MSGNSSSKKQETPSFYGQIVRKRGEDLRKCEKLMEAFLKKHAREHENKVLCRTSVATSQRRSSDAQASTFPPNIESMLSSAISSGQASAQWYETQIHAMSTRKEKRRVLKGSNEPSPSPAQSPISTSCTVKSSRSSAKAPAKEDKVLKSFTSRFCKTHVSNCREINDENIDLFKLTIVGDGRCLFRSVAVLLFRSYGILNFTSRQERELADALRCETVKELRENRELLEQCFVIDKDFSSYVQLMSKTSTFGGEPELIMLSKLINSPICVYVQVREEVRCERVQTYGQYFTRMPFRILFDQGRRHFDALVSFTPPNWTPGSF